MQMDSLSQFRAARTEFVFTSKFRVSNGGQPREKSQLRPLTLNSNRVQVRCAPPIRHTLSMPTLPPMGRLQPPMKSGSTAGQIPAGNFTDGYLTPVSPVEYGTVILIRWVQKRLVTGFVGPYPYPNDITVNLRINGGEWHKRQTFMQLKTRKVILCWIGLLFMDTFSKQEEIRMFASGPYIIGTHGLTKTCKGMFALQPLNLQVRQLSICGLTDYNAWMNASPPCRSCWRGSIHTTLQNNWECRVLCLGWSLLRAGCCGTAGFAGGRRHGARRRDTLQYPGRGGKIWRCIEENREAVIGDK